MANSLVSIVTPTYNSSNYIERMIESIQKQTYTNWELLITDDCSSDETIELINCYRQKDKRIKLFQLEKNSGAGEARNFSISKATGRYIAFCDSDDIWKPNKLELQINFHKENGYLFTYTSYEIVDELAQLVGIEICQEKLNYDSLIKNCGIGCSTCMYDALILGKMYFPTIRKRQDWALWLKIIKKTDFAYGLTQVLTTYTKRADSISANKLTLIKYNYMIYHDIEGFSHLKSSWLFITQFIPLYILKKLKQRCSVFTKGTNKI